MAQVRRQFEVMPDTRPHAVEPCDGCGARTVCIRKACPVCRLIHSVCDACQVESGGRALDWQVDGHIRRAHQSSAVSRQVSGQKSEKAA